MNKIQASLKQLSSGQDLSNLSIREVGRILSPEKPIHPELVKYHWKKLFNIGGISYLYKGGVIAKKETTVDTDTLSNGSKLISIPVYGVADCGPATQVAEQSDLGTIRLSSRLLKTHDYSSLYALMASGMSMNKAVVDGHTINNGDYVVVNRNLVTPSNGECVVAIVDGLANIKRFFRNGDHIALLSDSTEQYDPIFIHSEDQSDSLIGGTVIQVVEKPKGII